MSSDDYDSISDKKSKKNRSKSSDDFPSMCVDLFKMINWKIAIFLFIIGIIIFSDIFVENILSSCSGAVEGDTPTTSGTVIQLVFLTIGYILVDVLVQGEIL